jgi:hypothetical protein
MQPDYTRIWPYVFAALVLFVIYRRLRRSFGRQPWSPVRMWIRLGLLAIVGLSLAPAMLRSPGFFLAGICGLAAGVGLGAWGAAHTRYQRTAERLYYIPHTYTGILVTLLFLGRLIYRMVMLSSATPTPGDPTPFGSPDAYLNTSAMMTSPLTIGLLYVLVGYYVYYYGRLLWKVKHIAPEDIEVETTSSAT